MTTKRTPALFTIFNTSPTDTEWGKVVLVLLLQIIILLLSASLACYSMRNKN